MDLVLSSAPSDRARISPVRGWDYTDSRGVRQGVVGRVRNEYVFIR